MVDLLSKGTTSTRQLVTGVRPGDFGKATPCPDWDVKALLNHLIGEAAMFATAARGEAYDPAIWAPDRTGGDLLASYDAEIKQMLAAFGAPGALERTVELPLGKVPATMALELAIVDNVVHGWDLAKATGQDPTIDASIAEGVLAAARSAFGNFPRGEHLAPIVPVAGDASATDRLVAFMGRTP